MKVKKVVKNIPEDLVVKLLNMGIIDEVRITKVSQDLQFELIFECDSFENMQVAKPKPEKIEPEPKPQIGAFTYEIEKNLIRLKYIKNGRVLSTYTVEKSTIEEILNEVEEADYKQMARLIAEKEGKNPMTLTRCGATLLKAIAEAFPDRCKLEYVKGRRRQKLVLRTIRTEWKQVDDVKYCKRENQLVIQCGGTEYRISDENLARILDELPRDARVIDVKTAMEDVLGYEVEFTGAIAFMKVVAKEYGAKFELTDEHGFLRLRKKEREAC